LAIEDFPMRIMSWARFGVAAVAALALAGCATGPQSSSGQAAPAAKAVWAHDASDLAPDPAVRYGVLPNGMRYAIKRNTQPAGIAALRLRIDAGSLQEEEDQRGLAHFLEHMAFNGSQNVREGEMVKILERKGLAFGPDTNAYTSFGETVYMLDLPNVAADTVETGLMLMRETADRLTMSPEAIDRERGIILSEERSRNTPELRTIFARYGFWMEGQRVPTRFPIGDTGVIKSAQRDRFVDFYQKYYRPERATFIVVGDIDVDAIEADIKKRFADWRQPGANGPDPDLGAVRARGPSFQVITEPQGSTTILIAKTAAPDLSPDTRAERKKDWVEALAMDVVNRRLERLARSDDPPFIAAGVGRSTLEDSADIASMQITAKSDGWARALAAGEQELRRAVTFGVTQAELDRETAENRAGLEQAVAGAETRDSRSLARALVGSVDEDSVFTAPKDDLVLFDAAVKGLTADAASAALRAAFEGAAGPLVSLATSKKVAEADLRAAFEAAQRIEVKPAAEEETRAWDYVAFGQKGAVVERRVDPEIDTTFLRFANGVRLNVKKTPFDKDQISVSVRLPGGAAALPKTTPAYSWALPFAFTSGALGRFNIEQLERALTGKVVGVGLSVSDDAFLLRGTTRNADLALQLQLAAAYVTDPGWRGEGLARLKATHETRIQQTRSNPSRLVFRELPALLRSNDPRWRFPQLSETDAVSIAQLRAVLDPVLKSAPIEVSIVGDVEVEAAIEAVAATFGALAPRAESWKLPPIGFDVRFPPGKSEPVTFTHAGRPDQGMALIAFKGRDFSDMRKARAQGMVRELLDLRMTDEIREKQAAAYSPSTFGEQSLAFPGFGFTAAFAETPPEQIDTFFKTVDAIQAELREGRFDDDLIVRARKPLLERLANSRKTNSYWAGQLIDAQANPQRLAALKSAQAEIASLTKDEIVAAAKELFAPGNTIRVRSTAETN
jgi:zinc protease